MTNETQHASRLWNLDERPLCNEAKRFLTKNGFDKGAHKKFTIGERIEFFTGYNNHIRAVASIKGIDGEDLYVYTDSYWFPIQDDERGAIAKENRQ